jgi:hypothetical protein
MLNMDELFSCRNCIQNCGQSLNVGAGTGFCLRHDSVIWDPADTTCKYLHRKDLPRFLVDDGLREHAAEFAGFSGMARLHSRQPLSVVRYSQKFAWEKRAFDPLTNVLAQYHKSEPAWIFIESFTGGLDGRRALAHGCLVRRYMDNCDSWKSSYRLVLAFLQEIDEEPHFSKADLRNIDPGGQAGEALWDVVFARFSLLQEYGWHAGLDQLRWVTDQVNGALVELDWPKLCEQLVSIKPRLTDLIIDHARMEGVFFDQPVPDPDAHRAD